jgi:acetoin utilization deacetylase AcuC-like enzyme
MTLLYTDPVFLLHETGRHVERPSRLRSVLAALNDAHLPARCILGRFTPLTEEELRATHPESQIELVRETCAAGGGRLDPDTVVCPESYRVALNAAGACCSAVDAVLAGPERSAMCLVRPPGHHATDTQSMGFCLFNNIALAARRARNVHGVNRVLIVDWDVHHGNGTQDIFYADETVTFFSIHRYGNYFYPGTGALDETGSGHGRGATLNAPIRYGTSRHDYLSAFTTILERAADRSRPELVLLSAGFDAHALDPIGSLGLEVEDFIAMSKLVRQVATTHAQGRLVSCLEGGYNLDVLGECVAAHLDDLLAESAP